MIRLHESLSEFSYGYGVTYEVQNLLESVGLIATPFLPNLVHEKQLGFDVGFGVPGRVVVLQFKLGEELRRFHRSDTSKSAPSLDRPFWRFRIDTAGHQFQLLRKLENSGAEAYYVAPRFADWTVYERAFEEHQVLEKSLIVKPSEIEKGARAYSGSSSEHRIVYDRTSVYVCSEPVALTEESLEGFPVSLRDRLRTSDSLEAQMARLSAMRSPLSHTRWDSYVARSKTRTDAMAALLGLEAWSMGAQLLFVTEGGANPSAVYE